MNSVRIRILLLTLPVLACLVGTAGAAGSRGGLFFEPNAGQFLVHADSHLVQVGPSSATFSDENSTIRVNFNGANVHARAQALERLRGTVNHFKGSDPRNWLRDVPAYSRITYNDVYPGVDLTYYAIDGELEFDFIVSPTGLPGRIHMSFEGAERVEIDQARGLKIHGPGSMLSIRRPVAYQIVEGARREVETTFELSGQSDAVLRVKDYDSSVPLVIDPVFSYSTYLGGAHRDTPTRIAVDAQGNAYIVGQTFSVDFPQRSPIQTPRGNSDAFLTKLDPAGNLVYSTFIGGDLDDAAQAVSVDAFGNVYVAGSTFSQNFPLAGPLVTQYGGSGDGFILRFDASGGLRFGRYLNGDAPDIATGITTDRAGNIYVTGNTRSTNFPMPWVAREQNDAFLAKFAATGELIWGSIIGGTGEDSSSDVVVDLNGLVYIVGTTSSTDLGTILPLQAKNAGLSDCFIAIATSQGAFVYSSYIGGSGQEVCTALSVDTSGITIVGSTQSSDFPTQRPLQASIRGASDGFITKLSPDGSRYIYSTFFGGSDIDMLTDVTSDGAGGVFVAGRTFSTDFPLVNPLQTANQGSSDAIVAKISANATLTFSTYIGGGADDVASGIALDSDGNVVVVGTTISSDFPVEQAFQPTTRGDAEGFVSKIPPDHIRPRNDDFNNATVLDGLSGTATGNNLGASLETGEPVVGRAGRASVWWRWTAPSSGTATFDTIGSSFDTILAVFEGTQVTNLRLVASDDESGGAGTSLLSFQATQGVTYRISVNGSSTETGNITLHWQLRPPVISVDAVTITGMPAVAPPATLQTAGLKLAAPYPLPLRGRLTLTFIPDPAVGVDDAAIQFSNGSRSVDFTLATNTTDAVFADGSMTVTFQTGTAAGTISIGATFLSGDTDVSPSPQPRKSAAVAVAAPTVTDVTIRGLTDTTFEVVIDGFSTARSISSIVFAFVPAPGRTTQTSSLTIDVEGLFKNWYQGADSKQFGSRFRLVVPFSFAQGKRNSISAIAVALVNSVGTSAGVTRNFQ